MWESQINSFAEFLTINPTLFHNIISIIIYLIVIFIALKNGANGGTLLISYFVISGIFAFVGLKSYVNIVSLIVDTIKDVIQSIFIIWRIK